MMVATIVLKLQIQGKASGELRNRLLDVYNLRMKSSHLDNTSSEENTTDADRDQATAQAKTQARPLDKKVLFSEFSKEIGKIWSTLKIINDRFSSLGQPRDEEKNANSQLINIL